MEQVQKLRNEQNDARQELETVRGTSVQEMWKADLTSLEEVLEEVTKATSLCICVALVSHTSRSSHHILQISIVPDEEVKKSKKNNRAQTAPKPKTEPVKKEGVVAPKKKPEQKKITTMLPKSSDIFDMELGDIDSEQLAKVYSFFSSHHCPPSHVLLCLWHRNEPPSSSFYFVRTLTWFMDPRMTQTIQFVRFQMMIVMAM